MPTENRSSNTVMVSLPRERALQLINLLAAVASAAHWLADNSEDCGDEGIDCQRVDFEALSDALDKCEELPELPDSVYVRDGWLRAADELRALLAQPAEQHQGDPVALPARKNAPPLSGDQYGYGWNACLDEITKLGPLYTHADPGEVERLQFELSEARAIANGQTSLRKEEAEDWAKERDTLRAQLAEWGALLRDLEGKTILSWTDKRRISAALSASAEPSEPVVREERAEFEREHERIWPFPTTSGPATQADHQKCKAIRLEGWQARAALESKPS